MSNQWANSYAPSTTTACQGVMRRTISTTNQTLSPDESRYISSKISTMPAAWQKWLQDGSSIGYNTSTFSQFPQVGFAMGGSGLRGSLFGAGVLNAFDGGNATAKQRGTGGFQGVALFNVGASGASFLPAPLIRGANPRLIVVGGSKTQGMLLNMDLATPAGNNINAPANQQYYANVLSSVYAKGETGFQSSMTDIWSRMISYHALNGTTTANFYTNETSHGANDLWSDFPVQTGLNGQDDLGPFPIITVHTQTANQSDPITYEITPYEMGAYDPRLNAMVPTKYIGTKFKEDGTPDGQCVTGFDQTSYLLGTSSSPFYNSNDGTQPNTSIFDGDAANAFAYLLGRLKNKVQSQRYDVGNWPNPFKNITSGSFVDRNQDWLHLGDAMNYLPIDQLMVKARNISVIVAIDATGDTTENKWPDGTGLKDAAVRAQSVLNQTHQAFPPIPNDFVNTGVNLRPTFFGCNATKNSDYPLVIYIPNAPPADGSDPVTNPNSFKTSYSQDHQEQFFTQSYLSATSGFVPNAKGGDAGFPDCLKCAAIDRARLMVQPPIARSTTCQTCFDRYCYYPDHPPSKSEIVGRSVIFVDPDLGNQGSSHQHKVQLAVGVVIGVLGLLCIILALIFWRQQTGKRRGPLAAMVRYKQLFNGADADPWSGRHSFETQHYEMEGLAQQRGYRDPYTSTPQA